MLWSVNFGQSQSRFAHGVNGDPGSPFLVVTIGGTYDFDRAVLNLAIFRSKSQSAFYIGGSSVHVGDIVTL